MPKVLPDTALVPTLELFKAIKRVEAARAVELIKVDGVLNESVWQRNAITDFTQYQPSEGDTATQRTEVWVAYDDAAIYVAARLYDTHPDSISRAFGRRDAGVPADWFRVELDAYHDRRTGFLFLVTPSGSVSDGVIYNDEYDDDSWDGVWSVATKIDDKGWIAEMRIPYSQLRFAKAESYVWGINFTRFIQRRNEFDFFARVGQSESGRASKFAELHGIQNIAPPPRFALIPYLSSSGKFTPAIANDPFRTGQNYGGNIGADLKLGLGSNLTLDATVNPDFGQAEVDPAVVNLSAYEVFYEERRSFFIEGSSIFDFGNGGANDSWNFNWGNPQFFYSRRIGRRPQGSPVHEGFSDIPDGTRILGAAKLSGNVADQWTLGALSAVTASEFARVDSSGTRFSDEVEPLAYYGVVRSQKQFGNGRQALGMMGTATVRDLSNPAFTSQMNRSAFSFGLDGWTFLDSAKMWVVTGYAAGTSVQGSPEDILRLQRSPVRNFQRPDATHVEVDSAATSLGGWVTRWYLNKQQGDWTMNVGLGAVSPGLETNDLGFNTRTDLINGHIAVTYRWFKPDNVFRTKRASVATFRGFDFQGNLLQSGYYAGFNGQLVNWWGGGLNLSVFDQTLDSRQTRGGPLMYLPGGVNLNFFTYSDDRQNIYVETYGSGFRGTSNAWNFEAGVDLTLRPLPQLRVTMGPSFSREYTPVQYVSTVQDAAMTETFGARYVFADLTQTSLVANARVDWAFTPKLTLQLYTQLLFAVGDYANFKELARPSTIDFNVYGEGGSRITPTENG
ncbi:MAG: carbohydrate binding family 9 domain-containing protein, partial [Rhizobacter sp.]|nr:carbohydrate binding family 9 domain-containing protein [Chlorobiales bacterium]